MSIIYCVLRTLYLYGCGNMVLVLFYERNRKWSLCDLCLYNLIQTLDKIWSNLKILVYTLRCCSDSHKLSNSPKLIVFASGYISTSGHFLFLKTLAFLVILVFFSRRSSHGRDTDIYSMREGGLRALWIMCNMKSQAPSFKLSITLSLTDILTCLTS